MIKFGGGFYCGLIEVEGKEPIYVFNGFFMSMRSKFTAKHQNAHTNNRANTANEKTIEQTRQYTHTRSHTHQAKGERDQKAVGN